MDEILNFFPEEIKQKIKQNIIENIEEIRIRTYKPIILKNGQAEKQIDYIITPNTVLQILQKICENSIYSYQNQICNGFITLHGGHRVGITGNAVIKDEQVINLNYISSLNFRIARQVFNCSSTALPYIINSSQNDIYTTLIVSPPGCGKTTLLRDLVRRISNGIPEMNFKGVTCGIVDERGEISALYKGVPQNDIGIKVDIIENVSKDVAMKMLIRSMTPKVIVADEIGNSKDIEAINYAICSGSKGIFTAHGSSMFDITLNPMIKELISLNIIERIIFLDENKKGNIKEIYYLDKKSKEYILKEI